MVPKKGMIKVFDYIPKLDCFKASDEYSRISEKLGLVEWNEVVWIGRYVFGDNDFGEHWFDNDEEREALRERAGQSGYDADGLLIVVPRKFTHGSDGPVHTDELRKMFWTDVLKSLCISLETIAEEARFGNESRGVKDPDYIKNLERKIEEVMGGNFS